MTREYKINREIVLCAASFFNFNFVHFTLSLSLCRQNRRIEYSAASRISVSYGGNVGERQCRLICISQSHYCFTVELIRAVDNAGIGILSKEEKEIGGTR